MFSVAYILNNPDKLGKNTFDIYYIKYGIVVV